MKYKLFEYQGNEPDDWLLLTSNKMLHIAKETGCVLGMSLYAKVYGERTAFDSADGFQLLWIRRADSDAIRVLRQCAQPDDSHDIILDTGSPAFRFPGDDPDIEEVPRNTSHDDLRMMGARGLVARKDRKGRGNG